MLRIIHVLGGLNRGGAETMIMNLYRNIDRTKIQFDFIIHTDIEQEYEKEVLELGGRIYRFPKFLGKNYLSIRNRWKKFFLNHPEYKILHSHVRSYASVYIPIAKRYGLVTIIHSHSTSNGKGILAMAKNIMQFPLRYQADYFFGCSKEAGEWLFGKRIINSDKYYMLPNAIDVEKYKVNKEIREKYRRELGIGNQRIYIHVGRLHPAKNHMFLIDVFAAWVKKNPNDILLIVGDGELRQEIENKINKLGLNDSIKMLGSRKDVSNLLQAADCFLFPSLWEGLPVSVVEAQAAGLPCLVSANVTDDVFISELAIKLPVNQGINYWIKKMDEIDYSRKDVSAEIKKAGFEIKTTANWLENFYMKLIGD